ncbi:nucleolar protein 14 [Absidia repens]|uniref:Nucleolar protein 14 n=1 Tax=Absidia repens TaxID=90262 RepID=A0A1X2I4M6_9FUNG|nr:nucleolar protein 14 [Absidia repens]
MNLTHYGQSLADIDDFDDTGLALSDEEDNGQLDRSIVNKMHFGGFDDDEKEAKDDTDRPKSKNEVMKELIAKSKMHKYERQMAKQEDDDIRAGLDEDLNDIRGLLNIEKRKPLPSQNRLFAKTELENNRKLEEEGDSKKDDDDYEDYDKALRDLAFDRRAQATDRTKTEEELAVEEKEQLEKAERARKRRMEGLDSESEDEGRHSHKRGNKKQRKSGAPQGDDLDDDYLDEMEGEKHQLGAGLTLDDIQNGAYDLNADMESGDDEDDSGEDDEDDDNEDDDEDEESEIDDLEGDEMPDFGDDDDDDMNELGQHGTVVKKHSKPTKTASSDTATGEIPYTFECPTTHSELLSIMDGLKVEDVVTVVKRIRVLYHVKISPSNKEKMAGFLGVVVDHLGYVASTVSPLPTKVLEALGQHIFEMAQQVPDAAAQVFTNKVKQMHGDMSKKLRLGQKSSCWPDVEELTILRSLGQVFSTSDLNHLVATPASLFMAQALSQCPTRTETDVGRGLFLTRMFLEYQTISKRLVPEALNFLHRSIVMLVPESAFAGQIPGTFPLTDEPSTLMIEDTHGKSLTSIPSISLEQLVNEGDGEKDNTVRLSLMQASFRMIEQYLQLYASTPALVEIFEPTLLLVKQIQTVTWHKELKTLIDHVQDRLERQIKFCVEKRIKTPLRMQQHRPIPIAQHLPKFEKGYSMDRHYDPDHERSSTAKLEAQLKKEKKGAMRELRKDNMFMAREKAKMKKQKDEDYNKMIKGVMTILEGDQAEKNRMEREKMRESR